MGMGISVTAALRTNKKVIVFDTSQNGLDYSYQFISKWAEGQVKKGKVDENLKNDT